MKRPSTHRRVNGNRLQNRRGVTLVLVAIMFTVLIGFVAMALDFGRMYSFKAELRRLTDAVALSAAKDASLGRTESQAELNAFLIKPANTVENNTGTALGVEDITAVNWNFATGAQTAGTWGTANAVQVAGHYTANWTLARVFGSNNRLLNDTSVAAFGSLSESKCLMPFAIPYAALLQAIGEAAGHVLTADDIEELAANQTPFQFKEKDPAGGNPPGSFGWIDVVGGNGQSANKVRSALNRNCTSTGYGVGDDVPALTGNLGGSVQTELAALCGGTATGNGSNYVMTCNPNSAPVMVGLYSSSAGNGANATYRISTIGAFKLLKQDSEGLWGSLVALSTPASGPLVNGFGPVMSVVLVK